MLCPLLGKALISELLEKGEEGLGPLPMRSWFCSAWNRARLSRTREWRALGPGGRVGVWETSQGAGSQLRVRRNFLLKPLFSELHPKHLLLLSLLYLLIVLAISNTL